MKLGWKQNLVSGVVALALSGCAATQQSSVPPAVTPETTSIATIPADPDPALWVLRDEDTTVYLFGTVHILKPNVVWFDEAVKTAFDKSDELVVEMIEPGPKEMVKIVGDLAIDKTGVSLRDKLEPDDRKDFEEALKKLKMPANSLDPLEPWFASVTLSLIPLTKAGYDPNKGVEDALNQAAKARQMKITPLETVRQQLGFFDNLPEDVQLRFFNFTVDTIDEMSDGMENMVAQWALGDIDALGALVNAGLDEKILYETLLVNRNKNWADWVEKRMDQPGTIFIAVGAGHLAGKDSLQTLLKEKGLKSERVEY